MIVLVLFCCGLVCWCFFLHYHLSPHSLGQTPGLGSVVTLFEHVSCGNPAPCLLLVPLPRASAGSCQDSVFEHFLCPWVIVAHHP